jgi:7-keto-8-aminopelargonate synthetase-like enzyme
VAAAAREALRIVETEPERIARLHRNIAFFREGLRSAGFDVPPDGTPIFPVIAGDADRALRLAEDLLERGAFARAIRPPTVPEGTARVRATVSAAHEDVHLERALDAFEAAGRSLGLLGAVRGISR